MTDPLAKFSGKCSWFGGPDDTGVSPDEGLAFIYEYEEAPTLFLPEQPEGTTGLARRLNPDVNYVACRWDYDLTPKDMLAGHQRALVRAPRTGKQFLARPADWGPHEDTGRVADISPGLMEALDIATDDEIEVIYPAPKPERSRRKSQTAPHRKEKRHAASKPSAKKSHVRRSGGKKHARHTKKRRTGIHKKR